MKKIINEPNDFVKEYVEGICLAHSDQVKMLDDDFRVLVKAKKSENKVAIVTAGGSGHLPVFLGYVGQGLIDGCAIGDVFASPSSTKISNMIRYCDSGKGVLCLYGNYGGDKMNFALSCDELEIEDINTRQVLVKDDVASADYSNKDIRRGVAGMVYAFKIAGAKAQEGASLDEVVETVSKALDNIKTMGVALSPCIVPTVGKPTFQISEDKIEIGMGIHGEAGIEVKDMMRADEISELLFNKINDELKLQPKDRVSVMVNGLGATPLEELYIVYRKVAHLLKQKEVQIVMPHVGEFATSMEMAGLSLTVMKLDDELEKLLIEDARSPFYTNYNK